MSKENWRIWNKDDSVEQRTYKRVTGELPEMESTKQLVRLVGEIYTPGMKVLDVGCAAGHYYNGLKRIDSGLNYTGFDSTVAYIDFAKKYFSDNPNTKFEVQDIFKLPSQFNKAYDIVFSCNVILHLPSMFIPVKNLLSSAKKFCFIRTLLSEKTHLSKLLYSDTFDENGDPTDFVYQNTYSFSLIEKTINSFGNFKIEFINDEFDSEAINNEFNNFRSIQSAVTEVKNGVQIAGSKVFEWKWIKVSL